MKIGITERGDASIDYSWYNKLSNVDGAVLITKNITDEFINAVITAYNNGHKLIVHTTCTGFGNTSFEPNVYPYKTQLNQLKKLIDKGFPAVNCVLCIDPVFPTQKGLLKVKEVLDYFDSLNTNITRIRISIYDEYRHAKKRLLSIGKHPLYENFYADINTMNIVADTLSSLNHTYEVCAEDYLALKYPDVFKCIGCISVKDLQIMKLTIPQTTLENGQNRNGCHCLTCKTELLTQKHRCPNNCIYCYWHN